MKLALSRKHLLISLGVVAVATAGIAMAAHIWGRIGPPTADADQPDVKSVIRALFVEDRLWLLTSNGSLVSIGAKDARPARNEAAGKIVDICKSAGRVTAVSADEGKGWKVEDYVSGRWAARTTIAASGEKLVAVACSEGPDVTFVTNRRVIEVRGDQARSIQLGEELEPAYVAAASFASSGGIWIGFNNGEWGGGLRRIASADGKVETIERNKTGSLCGGPLNTGCDSVNGIVSSPWNASCVVTAIGLVHMMSHGRIVEICGSDVRRVYFKALDPQPPYGEVEEGEPSSTVAYYGLARNADALWSVGIDGIYRWSGKDQPTFQPLPKFENRGGYSVSFQIPGIALVLTDANQSVSLSGAVPLMAAQ